MTRPLAVSTYSLLRWRREGGRTLLDTLDLLASLDLKLVEFSGLSDLGHGLEEVADVMKRAAELRKHCDDLGLQAVGYCTGGELLDVAGGSDETRVEAEVERICREIDAAAVLGMRSIRHDVTRGPLQPDDLSFAEVVERVVPPIRVIADHAASLGLVSSFENHGFYLQSAPRVRWLLDAVAHPNFRLTLDMGNFLCVTADPLAPVDAVQQLTGDAIMVHAKNFSQRFLTPERLNAEPGEFMTPHGVPLRGTTLGEGVIDVRQQLRLLVAAGYDGPVSLEFEGPAPTDPVEGVRRGLAFLRDVGILRERF